MNYEPIAQCKLCESFSVIKLIELKNMPSQAQYFPTSPIDASLMQTNLDIWQCIDCSLVQILDQPVSYYKEVIRSNKVSGTLREFRLSQLDIFIKKYGLEDKLLLEVGCGDGDILELIKELKFDSHGIEYREEFVNRLKNEGFTVHKGYVGDSQFLIPNLQYEAFISLNVLEHSPKPKTFLKGLRALLKPEAVGLVEVPNLDMVLSKNMLSEFMLEHLCYFTKETLRILLETSGFEILNIEEVWHDYMISAEVKLRPLLNLDEDKRFWENLVIELHNLLNDYQRHEVCVWGAGHQSLATISLLNLNSKIEFIIDSSINKQERAAPGSGIPITSPEVLRNNVKIACIIVLGGSYTKEIVEIIRLQYGLAAKIISIDGTKIKTH